MRTMTYNDCKNIYKLFKELDFWIVGQSFSTAVIELEKIADYLWDIDQEMSQNLFDFVHKMYDAVYFKTNKLNELAEKAKLFKVQIYNKYLMDNDSNYKNFVLESALLKKQLQSGHKNPYKAAIDFQVFIKTVDPSAVTDYLNGIGDLMVNYHGQYNKLWDLFQDKCGRIMKNKIILLENSLK